MKKKDLFVGLFIVILILGFYYVSLQKEASAPRDLSSVSITKDPEVVARQYYESHITRLNSGLTTPSDTLNPKYVTEKFISDTKRLEAGFSGGASYDPFLCAQDYPNNSNELVVNVLERNDSSTTLSVKVLNNWKPIAVSVVKENDVWKIDKIVCSQ